jgi:uncharacterized protein YbjT (DUF2867 family)
MIVVTGATGNVGAQLVRILTHTGHSVTAVARTVSPKPEERRADYRAGDLAQPETLKPILDGADRLFLICAGESPEPIVEVAVGAGVSHIVLLSSQGVSTRPHAFRHPRSFEDAVTASPLRGTILRPGGFATNTLSWAASIRDDRTVTAPFGDVALPVIDPADIASVAAAALTQPGHDDRVYELTGPELVSPRDQVQAIGEVLGMPLHFVEQSRAQAADQMRKFMPEPIVEATLDIFGQPLPQEQRVSSAVPDLLGRPARSFAEWVTANADAFLGDRAVLRDDLPRLFG